MSWTDQKASPTKNIYTRESLNSRSKAKLDHILINEQAYNTVADAGWITTNPYIVLDHGIIWLSLNKDKLDLLKQPKPKRKKT